jgi:dihydroorotase
MSQEEITILDPLDAHLHLRNKKMLYDVALYTSSVFPRAVVFGNFTENPIDDAPSSISYRDEIKAVDKNFQPIMSIMLTRKTTVEVIIAAYNAGVRNLKFIPGGASTGGARGLDLPDLKSMISLYSLVRELGMIASFHFELTSTPEGRKIPKESQELAAIRYLDFLVREIPGLKIVVEHASSYDMIEYVKAAPANVVATLTAHHALLTFADVCDANGKIIDPLNYCKPIAKTLLDRWAVRQAMVSGNPKFFFGSDSAPHLLELKRSANPPAGIFTAPVALPLLCQIFEEEKALDKLEGFVSKYGADFYGLPGSQGIVTIKKEPWRVPIILAGIPIFMGGQRMQWKVM